ncbi:head-tail adaptor protein [Bacillus cereus]|nr:head-tail adaptor protein [Bacillus cereus]
MIQSMIRKFGKDASVLRNSGSDDGPYPTEEWKVINTVKGVLDAIQGTKDARNKKVEEESTHFFYCLPFDITIQDRLVIDNKVYSVTYPGDPMNAGVFFQIELEMLPYEHEVPIE